MKRLDRGSGAAAAGWRVALGAVALLAAGCTTMPEVPPISSSGVYQPGKVVWRDLVTPDMEASRAFYSSMFGWKFESVSPDYDIIRHDGRMIGGMAKLADANAVSHWIPLVSVQDVDATAEAALAAGGRELLAPFDVPGRGRVALLADPWGAAFGVVRSASGDPPDRQAGLDEWLWTEIWSRDVPRAAAFYASSRQPQ
ncbi:MAG: VOC family protein [Gammaproteobacteria bacterium]